MAESVTSPTIELTRIADHGIAPSAASRKIPIPWRRFVIYASFFAYAVMVFAAIRHHELWADEAQAWLLARDVSLGDLWLHFLHYEGSPGLWQTLLHVLIRCGLSYSAYSYVPGVLGLAGAWLVMRHSPFPLAIRVLLPFTFFLGFQYAVIARSYDLLPPLLFGCAIIYPKADRRLPLFTGLLCAVAMVSVHGLILSACIAVSFLFHRWRLVRAWEWPRFLICGTVYLVTVGLVCAAAYPASDVTFVTHPKFSLENWSKFTNYTLAGTFTGEELSTAIAVGLTIPFLLRGGGLWMFVASTFFLCSFGAVIYAHVWHQGILLLAWLFAIWISAQTRKLTRPVFTGLAMIICVHLYWTASSIRYDWNHAYSAGSQIAQYIRTTKIPPGEVYTAGYGTTAMEPYFAKGELARGPAFWDWSVHNRASDGSYLLSSKRRKYVVVGAKKDPEEKRWTGLMEETGYVRTAHFEGNLFWHAGLLEPESLDLYHAKASGGHPARASAISMNDGRDAGQLLSGFYEIEGNGWRWTERSFSVALKPPLGSERKGAFVNLRVYMPERHIQTLGRTVLEADANGEALQPRTFSQPGEYVYTAFVPPSELQHNPVYLNFHFDKAIPPSGNDGRELGAVVSFVGLECSH